MELKEMINYQIIEDDSRDIEKWVLKTPLIRLYWLDTPNRKVWAKLECNQLTNSFKVRGAYNAIRKIDKDTPIITNSAGNHGLAIAYVLQKLNRKGTIFVPENASELKLRRLINMGVEVNPVGKDLYECGENAKKFAKDINGAYISPFSTIDVINGQGSLAVEVIKQKERFDHILIPLGGGGLLIGAGMYFKHNNPDCIIDAIHPEVFNRDFSKDYAEALSKPIYPTIADGLAVQHSKDDITAGLVKEVSDAIHQVSEDDIEMAIVSMLNNEGLLVEGASGTGIAALLNDPDGEKFSGDVLTIVSGGNISTSSLMHALAISATNNETGKLLGFNSISLPQEFVKYRKSQSSDSPEIGHVEDESLLDENAENIWKNVLKDIDISLGNFKKELKEFKEYCKYEDLDLNSEAIEYVSNETLSLDELLRKSYKEKNINKKRELIRIAIQKYSYVRNSLAWCSASSSQSRRIMFFDPAENNDSACNYDRYGSLLLKEREMELQKSLGYNTEKTGLLLTSSGQAAYTVVESFLLRNILSKNPTIVSCPYIYFENLEQIQGLKNVNFILADSWDIEDTIKLVEKVSAEALFIDPLANLGTLHTVDFIKFAKLLEGYDWSNKWLVIDGTMVSGGINLFEIFNKPNHPHLIYFESGSKYMQFGFDLQMAGVVIAEKQYLPVLNVHRRNTGTVMYQVGVTKLPRYDRKTFLSRMRLLTRNSEILCEALQTLNQDKKRVNITFPFDWRELGWKHGGGIVSINFEEAGVNNKPCLDYLIDLIIESCKKENIPITKGVSFGFSTLRISAAAAMAQNKPPFLRFSIGEETKEEMREICMVVLKSFKVFFEKYNI